MPEIVLVRGDITEQEVDAVVNAANGSLMGGGGVDGAIHRAGGPSILEECKRIRGERYLEGLPTGDAVATTGGDLPARWVIHTVGPVFAATEDRSHLLAACHTNSLKVADDLAVTSVAFPAISTGAYRYPVDQAARIAMRAVHEAETNVAQIRFVLRDAESHGIFEEAARAQAR